MNVTDSLVGCAAPQPLELESIGNSKGAEGVVPAGVAAGFGDLLMLLLATAGQPGQPAAVPTGDAGGAPEVDEAVAIPGDVVHPAHGAQAGCTGGEATAAQAACTEIPPAEAVGGDSGAGGRRASGVAAPQDGKGPGLPVFRRAAGPDGWVPLYPPVGDVGPVEESDAPVLTTDDPATPIVGRRPAADLGEAEAIAWPADCGAPAPFAGHTPEPVLPDEPAGLMLRMRAEPAVEAKTHAEAAGGTAVRRPGVPETGRVSREQPEGAPDADGIGEGATRIKVRRTDGRAPADGRRSTVESAEQPIDAATPSPGARPAVAIDRTSREVGEVRAAGRRPPGSIKVTEMAREIVEHGRLLKYPERTEVEIRLKPEWMGRVTLKVASQDGRVSARFIVAESGVKAEIESRLGELRHDMSEQGLDIGEISVSLEGGRQWAEQGGWTPAGGQTGGDWTTDSRFVGDEASEGLAGLATWRRPASAGTLDVMA